MWSRATQQRTDSGEEVPFATGFETEKGDPGMPKRSGNALVPLPNTVKAEAEGLLVKADDDVKTRMNESRVTRVTASLSAR